MGSKIVLTADRTLMSSYNGSMFIGFAACFPRVLPRWLYARLFCPTKATKEGLVETAPAGLRKIEASLLDAGFSSSDIVVVHPDSLNRYVDNETRVVGITTSDPLGLGPASSTFSNLLGRETYTAYFFRTLVTDPSLGASKAKIIVGGPGAWQLANPGVRAELGIDCLVEGEGELIAPQLFKDAVEGRSLPTAVTGGPVPVDKIPLMRNPTINGTVEVSRGCGRGCEFCNPNMRLVRHIPLERVLEEVRMNLASGYSKITLHAEDILRYRSKGIKPERAEVVKLFEETLKLTDNVGISHFALSSALSEPALIEDISRLIGTADSKKRVYGQTGVETGSIDLVNMHMRGKAKPFKPEEWPEVVREAFKLLSDNNWVSCGTLVMGLPGEKATDVAKTLNLIRDLRRYKCLIVPLFFVPLGALKDDQFFRPNAMLPEHWMLLGECIEHDFHWVPILMEELFSQNRISSVKSGGFRLAAWYMQHRLRPSLELMKAGKDPRPHPSEMEREEPIPQDRRERVEA